METRSLGSSRRVALGSILLAGAGLRLWQFLGNTALWVDEIALAENILNRPLSRLLFRPLDFDQVAPPGFLLIVKTSTVLFGSTEAALRLFPLLCALASLLLFALLAERLLSGRTSLFATTLFAFGVPLILYAAEVKQYSSDVAASLLMMLVASTLLKEDVTATQFLRAGLIGLAIVWFSQATVFVMAGLGLALMLLALRRRDRTRWRSLGGTLFLWAAGASASTLLGLRSMTTPMRAFLYRFWSHAFWPLPPRSPADVLWPARSLRGFWGQSLFQYPLSPIYLALMLLGFWAMWRRRPEAASLLLGPAAVMLAASAAGLYPFYGRLLLPLAPAFLLAASEGLEFLAARLPVPAPATAALFALPPLVALGGHLPVHRHEETRPMLAYVAKHRRPLDAIYVSYGAAQAFRYYGPRFGLDRAGAVVGGCHREDPRQYLREIDLFRGRPRVWLLFAHDVPQLGEQGAILGYLGRIGVSRQSISVPDDSASPVTAELYDLSVLERLGGASAETFPLPPGDPALARRLGCGSGPVDHAGGPT